MNLPNTDHMPGTLVCFVISTYSPKELLWMGSKSMLCTSVLMPESTKSSFEYRNQSHEIAYPILYLD